MTIQALGACANGEPRAGTGRGRATARNRTLPRKRPHSAPDVAVVRLQLPANDPLRYHAGQYVEFILQGGARRSYSIANAPHAQGDKPSIELHIRHMPGGLFTDHVFTRMKEKDTFRRASPAIPRSRFASWKSRCKKVTARCPTGRKQLR